MFDWLWGKPRCPVGTQEQAWVEWRMCWLGELFGRERLLAAPVLLPDAGLFPEPYGGTLGEAERLFERLATHLEIDRATLDFVVFPASCYDGTAGGRRPPVEGGAVVHIDDSQLMDRGRLAANVLFQLASHLLARETAGAVAGGPEAELASVYLGAGVIGANATLRDESKTDGRWHVWRMDRQGILPSHVIGYALALFCFARGERRYPDWHGSLRPDARSSLVSGFRYLDRTRGTLFLPETVGVRRAAPTPDEVAGRLKAGSPALRLVTLWDVACLDVPAESLGAVVGAVAGAVTDPDAAVAAEAARVLPRFGGAASSGLPTLLAALHGGERDVRVAAATALGALRLSPDEVVPELCAALDTDDDQVFAALADALAAYGVLLERKPLLRLLAGLSRGLYKTIDELTEACVRALLAVAPAPEQFVREQIAPDLRGMALGVLAAGRRSSPPDGRVRTERR